MVTFPCKWIVVYCKTCTRVNMALEPNAELPKSCPNCGSHSAKVTNVGAGRTSRQLPYVERMKHQFRWNGFAKPKDELLADAI